MDTIKTGNRKTKMIAHRGLSGIETENSCSAFVAAGNRSYFGIECDIHMTSDGKIVIIHDDETGRVAEKDINVEQSVYDEVRKIKLKNMCKYDEDDLCKEFLRGDLIIPNLNEYIGICKKYGKQSVIEFKNKFENKDIKKVVKKLEKLKYLENCIFISFSIENLISLRKLLPAARLQFLVFGYNEDVLEKMNRYNLDLDIHYKRLTKEIIDEVHKNNHAVNCWTCDKAEDAQELEAWGVDFITTNILE